MLLVVFLIFHTGTLHARTLLRTHWLANIHITHSRAHSHTGKHAHTFTYIHTPSYKRTHTRTYASHTHTRKHTSKHAYRHRSFVAVMPSISIRHHDKGMRSNAFPPRTAKRRRRCLLSRLVAPSWEHNNSLQHGCCWPGFLPQYSPSCRNDCSHFFTVSKGHPRVL